jgi:hypothetical protein
MTAGLDGRVTSMRLWIKQLPVIGCEADCEGVCHITRTKMSFEPFVTAPRIFRMDRLVLTTIRNQRPRKGRTSWKASFGYF